MKCLKMVKCILLPDYQALEIHRWLGRHAALRTLLRLSVSFATLCFHCEKLCRSSNYVRIQANGCGGADADCDPSASNVKVLLAAADEMLKQQNVESMLFGGKRIREQTNVEKMDWFAGELVLEHQRRSGRIAPTVTFKQLTPKPKS